MTRRMKGNLRCTDLPGFAEADCVEGDPAQPMANDRCRTFGREVMRMTGARVIGVTMRDQSAIHRTPGVDEKVARRAIDALRFSPQNHAPRLAQQARLHRVRFPRPVKLLP